MDRECEGWVKPNAAQWNVHNGCDVIRLVFLFFYIFYIFIFYRFFIYIRHRGSYQMFLDRVWLNDQHETHNLLVFTGGYSLFVPDILEGWNNRYLTVIFSSLIAGCVSSSVRSLRSSRSSLRYGNSLSLSLSLLRCSLVGQIKCRWRRETAKINGYGDQFCAYFSDWEIARCPKDWKQ